MNIDECGQIEDQQLFLPSNHVEVLDLEKELWKEMFVVCGLESNLQLILEVGMAAAIIALLVRDGTIPDKTVVKSPLPKCNSHLLRLWPGDGWLVTSADMRDCSNKFY